MDYLIALPVWLLAALIFALRIVDVSLGTCRTIAVVQGHMGTSVFLGFIEVLVWITVVANVIQHASTNVWLLIAYAAGFAAGNATGIYLERWLALGMVILRIVSESSGNELAEALEASGPRVFMFDGFHNREQMMLLYVAVRRRDASPLLEKARRIDPNLFYAVDTLRESNMLTTAPLPTATGWRTAVKMK
jgi:uncharacterized protein YebE (UPF0316 family)